MKAVIMSLSVVVGVLAPVQLDFHARHMQVEGRVKKMLGDFVMQRGVGGICKVCFKRSMYLFRESGVEIVVVELGSSISSRYGICGNLKEASVVLVARAAKGVQFPQEWRAQGGRNCLQRRWGSDHRVSSQLACLGMFH